MDLLATVRKEGSRGGRGDFKWSDVQTSSHRENYLGHSLMAPVGRWQKGKDLSWYSKGDTDDPTNPAAEEDAAAKAARERKEEIQRVKQAEQDAMAKALGLPVAPRDNPNLQQLGAQREVGKVVKEAAEEPDGQRARGIGYGRLAGVPALENDTELVERIHGTAEGQNKELQYALKEYRRRHGERRRSRSRDRTRSHGESRHRRHSREERRSEHRHRRRSTSHERHDRRRSRSRSADRDRERRNKRRRSRSPRDPNSGRHRHVDSRR